ncbi:MAG TPA: ABC transporter permease [Solirubrobacteraceae bacterium]|nr:ABC transporter permease [Solirubrobacteraceae bacterium]
MAAFLAKRLTMLVASLLLASFAVYGAVYIAPGSPIATITGGRALPPATLRVLEHHYHLDEPFIPRYLNWLSDALHGDFGTSLVNHQSVANLIASRIGTTLELVAYTGLLIVVFGLAAGIVSALRPGLIDGVLVTITSVLTATPSFVAAIVLISVFAVRLQWLPAIGDGQGFGGTIAHLTMPAVALAASSVALVSRVARASVREELTREHVQTAVSRGLPRRVVLRRHVLRNAAIPITTITGLTIASLFALAAIVEEAFNLNGIGSALVNAAASKDFPVVQAISLVLVAAFVITNALVDLLYALLDPRVELGASAA